MVVGAEVAGGGGDCFFFFFMHSLFSIRQMFEKILTIPGLLPSPPLPLLLQSATYYLG